MEYPYSLYFIYRKKNPESAKLLDDIEELKNNNTSCIVLTLAKAYNCSYSEMYNKLFDICCNLQDVVGLEEALKKCLISRDLYSYILQSQTVSIKQNIQLCACI
jgi:hypothetical protein